MDSPSRKPGNPNMRKGGPSINAFGRAGKDCKPPSFFTFARCLLAEYQASALKRGFVFDLSEKEFDDLIGGSCGYCGAPPSRIMKRAFGQVACSGIDRIDNSIGYVSGNCVSCCKQCNYAKRNMTAAEFLAWANRVTEPQRQLRPLNRPLRPDPV